MNAMYTNLRVAASPSSLIITSTSFCAFSTISSILAGWIRPSTISFSSAILATSRRIGSKSGQDYCFRCIIYDQVYTCHGLKSTDVTSLTSDDTSLHFVIR